MTSGFRTGCIGALLDEYSKAINELSAYILTIESADFEKAVNIDESENHLNSFGDISKHVMLSCYVYANYIREKLGKKIESMNLACNSPEQGARGLQQMFNYTEESLRDHVHLTASEVSSIVITTRLGFHYTLEVLLERAIVHILRHRRQIEYLRLQLDNREVGPVASP